MNMHTYWWTQTKWKIVGETQKKKCRINFDENISLFVPVEDEQVMANPSVR